MHSLVRLTLVYDYYKTKKKKTSVLLFYLFIYFIKILTDDRIDGSQLGRSRTCSKKFSKLEPKIVLKMSFNPFGNHSDSRKKHIPLHQLVFLKYTCHNTVTRKMIQQNLRT